MSTRDTTNGAAGVAGPPRFAVLKKFLYVGLGVKRWLLLGAIGIGVCAVGLAFVLKNILDLDVPDFLPWFWEGVLVGVFGVSIILASVYGLYRTLRPILFASATINRLTDTIYTRRSRGRGPKIVTIGGGTGLSVLLRGIKMYTDNISAIITVADDGGSSGRLRKELGMLPPGDFRNCLVAMTDDESLVGKLFQHRFDQGDSLEGHSFGNLFIAAMTEVTGSFEEALYESSKVLAIHGRVLPSTMTNLSLSARLADGSVVRGESNISKQSGRIDRIMIEPENAGAYEKAVEAIREAQLVLVGPGSLYTSILPNLAGARYLGSPTTVLHPQSLRLQRRNSGWRNRRLHGGPAPGSAPKAYLCHRGRLRRLQRLACPTGGPVPRGAGGERRQPHRRGRVDRPTSRGQQTSRSSRLDQAG